jgi:hypothetical protein
MRSVPTEAFQREDSHFSARHYNPELYGNSRMPSGHSRRTTANLAESNARHALQVEGGVSTAVRRPINISTKKRVKVIEIVGILNFFFIHCTRSNDYPWGCGNVCFVHSAVGWIHIIIAWGRKSQNNPD